MINNLLELLGYLALLVTGCVFAACFFPVLIVLGTLFSRVPRKEKEDYPSATNKRK